MMTWYKKLGFFNNPFSIKPAPYSDELAGYDNVLREISFNILSGKVQFVLGSYGEGKTALLKRVINDFGGKKELIYFSCNRLDRGLDLESLLAGRYGLLGKLFSIKPKNMILLLDEAQCLTEEDYRAILRYKNSGYLRSVVLVGAAFDKGKFTPTPILMSLSGITADDSVRLVRERVGNISLLSNDSIKFIFENSNKNPRELLKNCEEICRYAVENSKGAVTKEIVAEALKLTDAAEEARKEPPKKFEHKKEDWSVYREVLKDGNRIAFGAEPKKEAPKSGPKIDSPKQEERADVPKPELLSVAKPQNKQPAVDARKQNLAPTVQEANTPLAEKELIEKNYY